MKKDYSRDNWRKEYLYLIDDEYADEDYLPVDVSDDDDQDFIDTELLLAEEEGSLEEGYWHSNSISELDSIQRGTLILDDDDFESLILGYETDEALLSSQYRLKGYAEYDTDDYEEEFAIESDEDNDLTMSFLKLRDIEIPDDDSSEVKRLKRDIRMEALKRLEESARTLSDFKNLVKWYDELDANAFRRWRYHEIYRSGEDMPLESGEAEDGVIFPASVSDIISRQMRRGDFLDYLYCKPDTIHELITTDYIIRFLRMLDEKDLFFFRVLEALSSAEISKMRGTSDRYIRKIWNELIFHIRQKAMGVLIFRDGLEYSLTGQEREFLTTRRGEYEFRLES
ncbi:MAG: hypothetical protein J6H21_01285 [Firmicutes bacterium]|nr:hypothetical protein [Bacillota bacterium]